MSGPIRHDSLETDLLARHIDALRAGARVDHSGLAYHGVRAQWPG